MNNSIYTIPEVEPDDPELQAALQYFSRHLVSLSGRYQFVDTPSGRQGHPRYFGYSGFIISIRGLWFFITAGHILKKIDEALDLPNLTIFECKLIDSFGPDKLSDLPIPFDYRRAPKYYVFDEKLGLDFGLIGLESYYQGLLEKNNMVAVDESNWVHQHRVEFEFFLLLGLPEEFVEVERQEIANKRKTFLRLSPTMIRIDPAEDPPEASLETELPRFIGRFDPEIPLNSLIGMSGGPILGFKRGDDGQLRYWVVAVQSSQRRESGLIFGCPIPLIASIVESMMDDANDEEAAT